MKYFSCAIIAVPSLWQYVGQPLGNSLKTTCCGYGRCSCSLTYSRTRLFVFHPVLVLSLTCRRHKSYFSYCSERFRELQKGVTNASRAKWEVKVWTFFLCGNSPSKSIYLYPCFVGEFTFLYYLLACTTYMNPDELWKSFEPLLDGSEAVGEIVES